MVVARVVRVLVAEEVPMVHELASGSSADSMRPSLGTKAFVKSSCVRVAGLREGSMSNC